MGGFSPIAIVVKIESSEAKNITSLTIMYRKFN